MDRVQNANSSEHLVRFVERCQLSVGEYQPRSVKQRFSYNQAVAGYSITFLLWEGNVRGQKRPAFKYVIRHIACAELLRSW
jgi:hypothetical protein